jgi:hypothetical protein
MTVDYQRFLPQLNALFNATTWAESRHIIDEYPALATDNSDAIIFMFIHHAERLGDTAAAANFKQVSTLLRRCREVGIDKAFAERSHAEVRSAATTHEFFDRLERGE